MLGIGSSNLGIGIIVSLRDQFTANAKRIENSMSGMSNNAQRMMRNNLRVMRNTSTGIALAGTAMLMGMGSWIKAGAQFESTMISVRAVTGANEAAFEAMSDKAKRVAEDTIYSLQEVADAMKFMGMAGMSPETIMGTIESITALGTAVDMQIGGIGGAADIITNISAAFKLSADQTMRVSDVLVKAAISSNVSVQQLGESFKYSADAFKSLNIPLEEASAMLSVLGNRGLQASIAGTSIANAWRMISKAVGPFATQRQKDALSMMGLGGSDFVDKYGNMMDTVTILEKLSKAYRNMPSVAGASALEAITNIRGKRGIQPILDNMEEFRGLLQKIRYESEGESFRQQTERAKSFAFQIEKLTGAFSTFQAEFFEAVKPVLMPLVKGLTLMVELASMFITTPFGKVLAVLTLVGVALGTLVAAGIAIFASLGLAVTGVNVSLAAMGASGKWAFNSMSASAMRYLGILRGIGAQQRLNSAGQLIDTATGRYASRGKGIGGLFSGMAGSIGRLFPMLGRLIPILGRFGSALLGPIGIIAGVILMFFDFKEIIAGVAGTLLFFGGTLINIIRYIWDFASNILNPFKWGEAGRNFDANQASLSKGIFEMTGLDKYRQAALDSYRPDPLQMQRDRVMNEYISNLPSNKGGVNIYLDSQKIYGDKADDDVFANLLNSGVALE